MRCLWCHKDVEEGWAFCPDCGGDLVGDAAAGAGTARYRPAGATPFDPFVIASVRHVSATGPLVVFGVDGRVEANLQSEGHAVVCHDLDGSELFRLKRYEPMAGAVVALAANGPVATYVPENATDLLVRDGTSAPVAGLRLQRGTDDHYDLVETARKRRLAAVWRDNFPLRDAFDDRWTLLPVSGSLPIDTLGLVALPVVCAARFPSTPRPADSRQGVVPGSLDVLR